MQITGGIGIGSWLVAGVFSGAFISGDTARANNIESTEEKKIRNKVFKNTICIRSTISNRCTDAILDNQIIKRYSPALLNYYLSSRRIRLCWKIQRELLNIVG